MRGKLAAAFPQVVLPEKGIEEEGFRLPGGAFAPKKAKQVRLRILDSLGADSISPLLSGTRKKTDLPDLAKRYLLGEAGLFDVPEVDDDVLASVSPDLIGVRGRRLPPFKAASQTLKDDFGSFESMYRNASQQLRVAVHTAYLVSLQSKSQEEGKEHSTQVGLQRQLSEVQSHLARDYSEHGIR